MWLWSLTKFWTYSPIGFVCAVVWNCCELLHIKCPFAPWMFAKIIEGKDKRIAEL